MTDLRACAASAAETLVELTRARAEPARALAATQTLGRRLEGTTLRLLWESEPVGGGTNYDLLLELGDGGVLSMGYTAPGTLPFPLRGAQPWSDGTLVRVNGRSLRVDTAMLCLDFLWGERPLIDEIVSGVLIAAEVERLGIQISEAEVDAALDAWRIDRGLLGAPETEAYLTSTGVTLPKLEDTLRADLSGDKLRAAICGKRAGAAFEADAAGYRRARVSYFATGDRLEPVRDAAGFFAAADRVAARGGLGQARFFHSGFVRDLPAPIRARVGPSVVMAPDGDLTWCVLAHALADPILDEETAARVEADLFGQWLAARRAEAKVEWFWGRD